MTPAPPRFRKGQSAGFSLIEVAIAVSILAVALVALLGLMPAGMTNFRKAMDTSITSQIAQRILLDMQQADFDQVIDAANAPAGDPRNDSPGYTFTAPKRTASGNAQDFRYFDDQGNEIVVTGSALTTAQKTSLVYQVLTRIMPRASQPAGSTVRGDVALVTVQVARNPSGRTLPVYRNATSDETVSYRNLFDTTKDIFKQNTVPVFTYSALVGKNQG